MTSQASRIAARVHERQWARGLLGRRELTGCTPLVRLSPMKASTQRPRAQSALEDLPFYLVRAALSFRKFNDETLRAVGLASQAPGLATVLHALHEQDDCLIGDLIARTRLANGTVTGLLDRLERDRCIQRVQHADDRRSWRIQLTAKGRTLCKHLHRRHRLVMRMFAHALTPRETTALKRMLERIIREMAAYNGEK